MAEGERFRGVDRERGGLAPGFDVAEEPPQKMAEMIRSAAPHPTDVAPIWEDYDCLDAGRWKFTVESGWNEDVVNGLWMEGYLIREVHDAEGKNVEITVIDKRLLSTAVCPECGERNEPDFTGDSATCPDCGATW